MKRVLQIPAQLLGGLLVTAMYAMPQAYTVSARPGVINYIEGHTFLDGKPLSDKGLRSSFMSANDTLSTDLGKAEVLLTPGVFLRIGDNSEIRLISPSLTDTQVQIDRGEAMIEADGLLKDNHIVIVDHGASITILKDGLYRFAADPEPTAAVIDGKAQVYVGERKLELGKGHEAVLSDNLAQRKFDTKKQDDLYAWSNVRSEYDAAASYQAGKNVAFNNSSGAAGFGFGGWYGPGWYWNNAFNGWGWIPGDAAFFSPFGWGFYGLGYLPYAPVVVAPVGGWYGGRWVGTGTRATIPVNPNQPPAVGTAVAASPSAYQAARVQAAQAFAAAGGFRTSTGAVSTFNGGGHAWSGGAGAGGGHFSGAAMSAGGGGGHAGGASSGGHH